jgi:hypothetical protein
MYKEIELDYENIDLNIDLGLFIDQNNQLNGLADSRFNEIAAL